MSTPVSTKVYRVAGKLIKGATTNSAPAYGGTIMGAVDKVWLDPGIRYINVFYEELGRTGEVIKIQGDAKFRLRLRGWDDDALAAFFPTYSGSVISVTGSDDGPLSETKTAAWLWAPDRPSEHPGIYIPNGLPLVEANETSMRFSILYDLSVAVEILCLPTSTANLQSATIGLTSAIIP